MWKASLAAIAIAAITATAAIAGGGQVTKFNRASMRVFDANGQPAGTLNASDVRLPTPIVAMGKGGSFGINVKGKVLYLRGLDVQTEGVHAQCSAVQSAARGSGTAYAGTNAGMGGAADCGH